VIEEVFSDVEDFRFIRVPCVVHGYPFLSEPPT
jgi:hypothetical protein